MSGSGRRWNYNRAYQAGNGGSQYLSVTDQYLKDNGIRRKSIPKDGCCLFRAVADQVYLTQTCHWELRRMCANYIKHNHTKFHSFMTVSYKDYCWKLANCNLWGGEMELVALSEVLKRDIHMYHEQDGKVKIKKFVPKGVASAKKSKEILLLFSGNNHYDSLWMSREESVSSVCQSIIYELLLKSVTGEIVNDRDLSKAVQLKGYDFSQRSSSNQQILDKYPNDLLRGLAGYSFFNVPYRVYRREKEAGEKADRQLAVSLQFIIGDKVHVMYEGSQYTGDVLSGINNNTVEVFVEDIKKRIKVPLSDVKILRQQKSHRGHSNKTSGNSRNGRSSSSSNSGKSSSSNVTGDNNTTTTTSHTPRRSYKNTSKTRSSKQHQQQHQDTNAPVKSPGVIPQSNNPQSILPSSPITLQEQVLSNDQPIPVQQVEREISDQQQQEQPTSNSGFSEQTVRMSSLMGRNLDIFNQASLASINEAPESEWPILNADSIRNHLTTVMAGGNPQRCHLDGPPPPPAAVDLPLPQQQQLPFITTSGGTAVDGMLYGVDPVKLLIKEMDPPLELLKTGTPEGRQRFMFKFAQNCLLFYSKYISDPELEDSFSDLLYMEFEDFITPPSQYTQRDFSVATSLTSREGSQMDIQSDNTTAESDRLGGNTSRVVSEEPTHSPSDGAVCSPVYEQHKCNGHVTEATPSSIVSPQPTTTTTVQDKEDVESPTSPLIENGDHIEGPVEDTTPTTDIPTDGTGVPAMSPYVLAYPPPPHGHPHSPYGYSPYPMILPTGHMFPWFYPPPMATAGPYYMPMMQQPQQYMRPQSSEEEEINGVGGRTSSAGSTSLLQGESKLPQDGEDESQYYHNERVVDEVTSPTGKKQPEEAYVPTVNTMDETSELMMEETSSKKSTTIRKQDSSGNEDAKSSSTGKSHQQSRSFIRGAAAQQGSGGGGNQQQSSGTTSGNNTSGVGTGTTTTSGGSRSKHHNRQQQYQYRNNYNGGRNRHYHPHRQYHDQQQGRKKNNNSSKEQQMSKDLHKE